MEPGGLTTSDIVQFGTAAPFAFLFWKLLERLFRIQAESNRVMTAMYRSIDALTAHLGGTPPVHEEAPDVRGG